MIKVRLAMFLFLLAGVVFARHELAINTGSFSNIQNPGLFGQGSQFISYAYHFNNDWAFGGELSRVNFQTVLEKQDSAIDMRYRQTIATSGSLAGLFLQRNLELPLPWKSNKARGYLRLGGSACLSELSDIKKSERQTLYEFLDEHDPTYEIKDWSENVTLRSGYFYYLTFGSELFSQKDFYINMDMSFCLANLLYEYSLAGRKWDYSKYISLDETSQNSYWTSFYVLRFGAAYLFSFNSNFNNNNDNSNVEKNFKEETAKVSQSAPKYSVKKTEDGSYEVYELNDPKNPLYIVKDVEMVQKLPLPVEDIAQIEAEINKTAQ